jgi:hypothetical protein
MATDICCAVGRRHISSTWCCNPQFQLVVKKACDVVVALGQLDPRIEARGHVRKSSRKRSISAVVRKGRLSLEP